MVNRLVEELHQVRRSVTRVSGMKLLRIWVPDPLAPRFREEAQRQAMILRGAPEEGDALDLIEATADWSDPDS